MKFLRRNRDAVAQSEATAVDRNSSLDSGVGARDEKKSKLDKIPNVTLRTAVMAMLVAMGGFIFGYVCTTSEILLGNILTKVV